MHYKILGKLSDQICQSFRINSFNYSLPASDNSLIWPMSENEAVFAGNLLKLTRLIAIFTIVIFSPFASAAQELMEIGRDHYKVNIEYDSSEEMIRLKVKNDSLAKSKNWGGPYSVASPQDVQATLEQIKNFLKAYKVESEDIDSVVSRVGEFKYISRISCGSLHFSVESGIKADQSKINSLLGEIVKITNFEREDLIPSRSLLIDTFNIGEEQKIQLRMVLDQNGNFMSFSFAKDTGTMEGYKWYTKGNSVYLKDLRGDVVLSIDLEHFNIKNDSSNEGGLILVKGPRKDSIENEERTYARLSPVRQANGSSWKIDRYNTQHFRGNVAKNGVALSSTFAKHTPIVQLHGSDIYFPKVDLDKLLSRFNKKTFSALSASDIEDSYNECMGERTSLAQEQINFGHADIDVVEADNITFCERLSLVDQKEFRTNVTYRSCLLEEDVMITEEGFQFLNFGFLSQVTDQQFEAIVDKCKSESEFTEARSAVLQGFDDAGLILSSEERKTFQSELNVCFSQFGVDVCKEKGVKWIGNQSMIKFLEEKSNTKSNCSYSLVKDDSNDSFQACFDKTVLSTLNTYGKDFFREGSHSFTNSGISYSDEDFEIAHERFKACMIENLKSESSFLDQRDKWYQYEQECLADSLKVKIASSLKDQAYKKVDELMGWMEDEKMLSDLISALDLAIDNIIDEAKTLSSYEEIKELAAIETYSLISSHYLMDKINSVNKDSFRDTVEVFLLGAGESTDSLMPSLRMTQRSVQRRIKSQIERLAPRERLTYVKNLFKTTELNALSLPAGDEKSNDGIIQQRTLSSRKKCLDEVSVAQNINFSEEMKGCSQNSAANLILERSRVEFEKEVSSHFLVESDRSNEILSVLTELKSCLQQYTSRDYYSHGKYEVLMKGCQTYAHLQLRQNISREKLKSYRPIVNDQWDVFDQCGQNVVANIDHKVSTLPSEYRLDEVSSISNTEYKDQYLLALSMKHESLLSEMKNCEEKLDQSIVLGVKNYFIEKVPSLSGLADSEKDKSVLANFFDEELISQILKFHKINDAKEKGAGIDLGALVSEERVVTSEFGVSSLTNFLDTLGSFFNKGFIYDEAGMRTEVVVFKSELKDFLRWYNSNPNKVTVREAKDFFGQSQLGEHLALAVVSEQVYTKFTGGINEMRGEEVREFFSKTSCKTYWSCFEKEKGNEKLRERYDSMMAKYDNLLDLTKTMTSSYDFRRIIRPDTTAGEKVIEKAHDAVLAPAVLGVQASAGAQQELMDSLGEAILADNTDGGFSERFVEEVVSHSLKEEESSKSTIGKWLFYDQGDFEWDSLRKTKSGQEALNYYARFIMLPRMLGQRQKRYMRNLRQTQFEKLMRQAQSENEH